MGATTFTNSATGKTAQEAFNTIRSTVAADHGDHAYAGNITAKRTFIMVTPAANETPSQCIDRLLADETSPIEDKWDGPAGCIDKGDGNYIFFGWAPS